jgi:hypothetical protein
MVHVFPSSVRIDLLSNDLSRTDRFSGMFLTDLVHVNDQYPQPR